MDTAAWLLPSGTGIAVDLEKEITGDGRIGEVRERVEKRSKHVKMLRKEKK